MISHLAKDFISGMLVKDVKKRLTAEQALAHPWMTNPFPHKIEGNTKEEKVLVNNKANLRRFLARRRWQKCGHAIR